MSDTDVNTTIGDDLRIAVVDDAFAPPDRGSVTLDALRVFCEVAEEQELTNLVREATGIDTLDPDAISDEQIAALYRSEESLEDLAKELNTLFTDFNKRRSDLDAIVASIKLFPNVKVDTYDSSKALKGATGLGVVFLDYALKDGKKESQEIARDIYSSHRAFIVLMSDRADAEHDEENFRRETGLLRGFFRYLPKHKLVDKETVYRTLLFVPENTSVCHAIHGLVDAIEATLGGNIEELDSSELKAEPARGQAVRRFMSVLRTLPLQDFAILCELTLADEGHPLGDYVRRLFGAYLADQVFSTSTVAVSLKELDKLRFTEFLPLATTPSDSLKELYAASLTEPITNPWGEHPWENGVALEQDTDE